MKGKNVPVRDMCRFLGGDYDINSETCNFPVDDPKHPSSVLEKGALKFFVLQVIVGTSSPIIITFYRGTIFPVVWWMNFIILAIVSVVSFLMQWFKLGSIKESLARALVSILIMYAFALIIGVLHKGYILAFIDIIEFSKLPTSAVIAGIVLSSLISFFLVEPSKRKGEDTLNDFDEFSDIVIT